jgi:hypothetical protein
MYLKQITHALKSKLSTDHNISIKNAHIHELIASWNGYKSKASMTTSGFYETGYHEENEKLDLFFSRGVSFGYSTLELTELNNEIITILDHLNLNFIDYEELSLDPPLHNDGYWYRKRHEGSELSISQIQFANEYEKLLSTFEKNKEHLINAANHGSSSAASTLARFYADAEENEETDNEAFDWYMVAAKLGCIEAKTNLALYHNMSKFLVGAAEYGSKDCIDKIARQETSPEIIHYWNEVAKLYGHDITSNTAINEGGNWYIGHEGIDLPVISESAKNETKQKAVVTFDKYSRSMLTNLSD